MKKLLLLILLLPLLVACEEVEVKEMEWVEFEDDNGFSIEHPDWPGNYSFDDSLFFLSEDGCNVAVNKYQGNSENMYDWLSTYLEEEGIMISYMNEEKKELRYTSTHSIFLFHTKLKIYSCGNYAYNVLMSCESSLYSTKEQELSRFFDSVDCDESKKEEIEYRDFEEQDFSMKIPDWNSVDSSDAFVINNNLCNLYISSNENYVDAVHNWMYTSLEDCEDCRITDSEDTVIEYESYYEDNLMKSKADFNYCNYKTYIVSFTCGEDYYDEDVASEIIESIDCAQVYEPEIVEEEVVEEREEEVEEVKEEVVGLELPEKFGLIEPEWIVWFINSNDFFTYILSDYDRVNLILTDDENFNIKADLENGKIVHVEEGLYDGEISVLVPADDAIDIFNNIDNINFVNFLVFAAKIETDPPELKQEVINKILGLS